MIQNDFHCGDITTNDMENMMFHLDKTNWQKIDSINALA
uniref:Uncharacterized protein n=1 Tax=Arundo donax TaxID=35708 RepID=A0A0A9GHE2_ARUDO